MLRDFVSKEIETDEISVFVRLSGSGEYRDERVLPFFAITQIKVTWLPEKAA